MALFKTQFLFKKKVNFDISANFMKINFTAQEYYIKRQIMKSISSKEILDLARSMVEENFKFLELIIIRSSTITSSYTKTESWSTQEKSKFKARSTCHLSNLNKLKNFRYLIIKI